MRLRDERFTLMAAFAAALILCAVSGCGGLRAATLPKRDCPITSLLVNAQDFPARLSPGANPISSPAPDHAPESAWVDVVYAGQLATSIVCRRQSQRLASTEFAQEKRRWFYTNEEAEYGPWERPSSLTYQSQIADQYYVACGRVLGKYRCRMIARYQEYFVELFVDVSATDPDDGLSVEEFNQLLPVIDQRMATCLTKDLRP